MPPPQIVLRPSYTNRRQALLHSHSSASTCSSSARIAEVAGGTTAECAAICCCCTCGIVNLLLLPIYKVPAGLCRRALRRKRLQRLMVKKDLLPPRHRRCKCGFDDTELQIHRSCEMEEFQETTSSSKEEEQAVEELEKEMWARFYGAGFWRSPSQSSEPPTYNQSPLKPM